MPTVAARPRPPRLTAASCRRPSSPPARFKRGYKNVIGKGVELNARGEDCQLMMETSGHGALKENFFLDDGAYLAVKVCACVYGGGGRAGHCIGSTGPGRMGT